MNSHLPILKARKIIRVLNSLGFSKSRQSGSHAFFKHPDGRTTTIPIHPGKDIGKGLFSEILSEIEMTYEEFKKCL
jgi:predicted RNA binding protein YcfA (HicA-like mRNA interferase family)